MKRVVKVDLSKVSRDKKRMIQSMTEELEAPATGKPALKTRWANRFVASGLKQAPKRP
jgi:hypothetical protein